MTTSQIEFIKCLFKNLRPITFKKNVAQKTKILEKKLYETDMKAMGSKIGFITNGDTGAVELLASFEKGSEEYNELQKRIKVFRLLQGVEIDRSKGLDVDPFPKYFVDDKFCRNEMDKKVVIKKKPYFQKYVYPTLNAEYNRYLENMNRYSLVMDNCLAKDNKDEVFMKKMIDYNPISDNPSVMNKICHYLENNIQEIKREYTKQDVELVQSILMDNSRQVLLEHEKFVAGVLKEYKTFRKEQRESKRRMEVDKETFKKSFFIFCHKLHKKLIETIPNEVDLANIMIYVCYKGKVQENKEFVWDVCGKEILQNVIINKQNIISLPVACNDGEEGSISYLGTQYKIKEIEQK